MQTPDILCNNCYLAGKVKYESMNNILLETIIIN